MVFSELDLITVSESICSVLIDDINCIGSKRTQSEMRQQNPLNLELSQLTFRGLIVGESDVSVELGEFERKDIPP